MLCAAGFIITLIIAVIILTMDNLVGYIITLILGLLIIIYSVYDAYLCTNAINNGQAIPLLFGKIYLD